MGASQPKATDAEEHWDDGDEEEAPVGENVGLEEGEIDAEKNGTEEENLGVSTSTGTEKDVAERDGVELNGDDVQTEDGELPPPDMEVDMDLVDSPVREVHVHVAEVVSVTGNVNNESVSRNSKMDGLHVSGVKRSRMTYERQQPSVHVSFNSLTRASKQKLKELLQHWSEWHAQHDPAEVDSDEVLESGEETYFPALCVGTEKSSMVSFWIENETRKQHDNGSISLDGDAVPLYDRGFALGLTSAEGQTNIEGGLEIVDDAARCFNCGSYSHSLKECPKPRDHVAVNNARRQHKSKRHQNPGSRSATRYYQNSSGGKYDGLKPGSLDGETRKLLGLAELDPPPWLNRMRELGYPPGYLDPVDEDQPSGITIFTDEDDQLEQEDGEIIGMGNPEPPKKKSVDFPGINAPIPENADERLWEGGSSGFDFRNQSHHKMNHYSEPMSWRHNTEHRRPRDFRDDGPPGVDLPFSPSSYPPRYGNHESSYTSESPRDVAPAFARSYSDRGRGTSAYEDFPSHGSSSYSSSNKRHSPQDLGSSGLASESDDWRDRYSFHYSYRGHDDHDRHRHRSWR